MTEEKKDFSAEKRLIDIKLKRPWFKQAFLVNYMYPIVQPLHETVNPSKYIKLIKPNNNSESVVNRLTVSPEVMTFFEGSSVEYSQLVPRIEIYKIYIKNKKKVEEVLLPFEAYTNFQKDWSIMNLLNGPFRGREAGIQSVAVKMGGKGKGPFRANLQVITLKILFNDIKTLFREWEHSPGLKVSFADLIKYPTALKGKDTDPKSLPAAYRIKLSLGWNVDVKNPILNESTPGKNFAKAAQQSSTNFIGDLHTYDMDFREDGSVLVTATYNGAIEGAFSSANADIMNSYNASGAEISKLKLQLAQLDELWAEAGMNNEARNKKVAYLTKIKKMVKQLVDSRKKLNGLIKNAKGDDATFPDVEEQVGKDFNVLKSSAAGLSSKSKELLNAVGVAKGANKIEYYDKATKAIDTAIAKEGAEVQKQIDKEKENLTKAKAAIKASIVALESSMRAKHLFSHVERLIDQNKVGWISTGKKSVFNDWVSYREELDAIYKLPDIIKKEALEVTGVTKDAFNKSAALQNEMSSGTPPPKNAAKSAAKTVQQAFSLTTETEKIPLPDGSCAMIEKYKKIGAAAKLFLSDEYEKGEKIMFFTFGDLISTILDSGGLGDSVAAATPDFRLIFGNMEMQRPGSSIRSEVNLYFLPISLEIFVDFMTHKIVGRSKKSYQLMSFINDLIQFIMNKISKPFGSAADGKLLVSGGATGGFNLDITSINVPKNLLESKMKGDYHTNAALDLARMFNFGKQRFKNSVATKLPFNKISNTLLIQAKAPSPFEARVKDTLKAHPVLDKEEGIPHFMVGGENRGLLKSIKFTQSTKPGMAMAYYRQATGAEDNDRISKAEIKPAKFVCEMRLIGNPYFYIGQLFYVNTELISAGNFEKNNIMNGGYYFCSSVDTSIKDGQWETVVKGVLTKADSAIHQSKKSKGKKNDSVKTTKEMTATEKAQLDQKKALAELSTSSAISSTPKPKTPGACS